MKSFFSSSILFTVFFSPVLFAQAQYREGDIIGESEISVDPSTILFEAATSSRFGHVGIIFIENNQLVVYEETPPAAQVTKLADFMSHNQGAYAVIRRRTPLNATELGKIKAAAAEVVNKKTPYNHTSVMNAVSMNCSEFVKAVFASAKVNVGKIQTVSALNINAFQGLFWKMANQYEPIPLSGKVVTPVSIMQTSGWIKIDGRLNNLGTLTDFQLFQQWKSEGLMSIFEQAFGISEKQLEKLARP